MKTKTTYVLLFAIAILFSSKVYSQPSWVKQTPVDNDYYIGIGSAEKIPGSSTHISIARDIALEQIASGIAVSITGETSQHVLEQAGIRRETFEYNITSMAKAELEGYEMVDSWEDQQQYWVYYRLSKSRYHVWLGNRKRVAAMQAFDLLTQGEIALKNKEIATSMAFCLQAAREIGPYRGMGLSAPDGTLGTFIDVEVFSRLNNIFSSIRINTQPSFIQAKLFQQPQDEITISVIYYSPDGERIPVKNLPVKATLKQGNSSFDRLFPTNNTGNTPLQINRINSPGNIQIAVTPDIETLTGFTQQTINEPVFRELNLPTRTISIQVEPVRVMIVSSESNMNTVKTTSVAENKVRQYLTGSGWSIVNEAMYADFLLYINASTRAGTERQGIHTAFATGNISLTDNLSMEEILNRSISQVNAGGQDFTIAGELALERLGEKMTEVIQEWLE